MIQFVSLQQFDSKGVARETRHCFVEDRLLVIQTGRYEARIGEQTVTGCAGDVVFFPPRVVIRDRSFGGDVLRCVSVLFRWRGRPRALPFRVADAGGRMGTLAGWLIAEAGQGAPSSPAICSHYVSALAGEYIRQARGDEPQLVKTVQAFVRRRLAEPFRLRELAEYLHLHERYLIRRFRGLTGITPMAFVRRQRLEEARRLVCETDAPLKVIAEQVGIGDPYQLSRLFKSCFGVGVRELRKARLR